MVSGTTLPDGDPFLQRQNEPSGSVSTRNPLHLLAGSNDYRTVDIPGLPDGAENGDAWLGVFKSFDGGATWHSTLIPGYPQDQSPLGVASPIKGYQAAADPTVRAGTNGLFFYSGIAFNRGANGKSAVFVSRFIDNNNVPGGDPFAFLDTTVIDDSVPAKFIDKPYIAVDIPRPGGPSCTIRAPGTAAPQTFPAGTVYLAYQVFNTETTPTMSRLMLVRSTDCGATWSKPVKVQDLQKVNQGVQIAIDPATGAVYLTWRAFADPTGGGDAILFSKSDDISKLKFKKSVTFPIKPFDQGTSSTSFRTNAYPTLAVDGSGRIYLTWSERGWGPASPTPPGSTLVPGDARVVMVTSKDGGSTWTDRRPIENNSTPGHQIMPVVSTVGGKVSVVYYDLREDVSDVFQAYVDEANIYLKTPAKRHTLDIRVIQADPADVPVFAPSVQVSEYMMGILPDKTGPGKLEQLQFNVPNLPLYAQGTAPFIGDFIDIAGEAFVKNAAGQWAFNTSATGPHVVHAFWTDNRDVRPPLDGDWTHYTPPQSMFTSKACTPGQTGMRNSNIYTSRITPGLLVGAPTNSKRLLPGTRPEDRRSFVVFAQNNTDQTRRYRFTIVNQPPGGTASFLQFSPSYDPLLTIDTTIAPRSTSSRTVYVSSSDPMASVKVTVAEVGDASDPTVAPSTGLTGSVTLNPDPTNPTVTNPTVTNEVFNPTVTNPTVTNPTVTNPTVTNPTVTNPTVTNPTVTNPTVTNVTVANPTVTNPTVTNPTVTNPTVTNTDIQNPTVTNADLLNGSLTDTTWSVTNNGNTGGSFAVKAFATKDPPPNFKTQLLVYKTRTTPTSTPTDCALKTQSEMVLVASIPNPTVTNPTVTNPTVTNGDVTNPTVTNASLWLEPGEEAKVTYRVLNPERSQTVAETVTRPDGTVDTVFVSPAFNPEQVVAPAVVPSTVNTADAAAGITTVTVTAPLIVTTTDLAQAVAFAPYTATLASVGGDGTSRTWSLSGGALPPGMTLSPAGVISGTPAAAGVFAFVAQVTDAASPAHVAHASLTLAVAAASASQGLTTPEDTALPITLTAGGGLGQLQFVVTGNPQHGALSGTAPNLTYTPALNYNGPDSFTYVAQFATGDSFIISPSATINITVTPVNDPPVAANDAATTAAATPVTINVLANDTDVDGDPITIASLTQPAHGTAGVSGGAIVYTPNAPFSGVDSFTYQASDPSGALSNVATVSVTVTPPPPLVITTTTLPPATRNAAYSQPLTASGAVGATTWTLASGALPPGITLSTAGLLSGTAPNGCGTASFTVQVADAALRTVTQPLSLSVSGAFFITTTKDPILATFESGGAGFSSSCGTPPTTWSTTSALPPGVSFSPTGVLGGTPRFNGSFPLVVTATDAASQSDTKTFTANVYAVDQSTGGGPANSLFGPASRVAQTVTVGAAGTLTAIRSFSLAPVAPATACNLAVTIEGVNAATGAPDDTRVLTTSAQVTLTGGGSRTVPVTPIQVLPDMQLAVVFSSPDACQIGGATSDNYLGGAAYFTNGSPGGWAPQTGNGAVDVQIDTMIVNPALAYLTKQRTSGTRAVTLASGKVLIVGTDGTAEIFDPSTGLSTATSNAMQIGRNDPTVTLLADGRVLVAGGSHFNGTTTDYLASAEIFDPQAAGGAGAFAAAASMQQGRAQHSATRLADGRVLVAGGVGLPPSSSFTLSLASAEIYDPLQDTFTATGSMISSRNFHAAAALADGRVLVAGGFGSSAANHGAEIFDPASGAFTATGNLAVGRARATATLLDDGRVLVAGGANPSTFPSAPTASAEIFDPTAGTFSSAGNMLTPRQEHTATRLADGSVLLAGGARIGNPTTVTAAAERFVPSTSTFAGAPPLQVGREDQGAALLPDGRIAMTGGATFSGLTSRQASVSIELYQPGVLGNGSATGTPSIANPGLPDGFTGVAYGPYTLLGAGGTTGTYTFSTPAPAALPGGVTLSQGGVISGTPAAPGTYLFPVVVSDNAAPSPHTSQQTLRLRVDPLVIVSSLPNGYVGSAYSANLLVAPGVGGHTWSVIVGSLPAGLSFDTATNRIVGTPTATGFSSFTVRVVDGAGQSATAALSISVQTPLAITTTALSDGVLGQSYFTCLSTSGAFASPLTWSLAAAPGSHVPAGLRFASSNSNCFDSGPGTLLGETGTFGVVVTVTDSSAPAQHASQTYTFRIDAQEQSIGGDNTSNVTLSSTRRVAQIVTAGTPFGLTGVQLWSISSCTPGMTVTATIRPVIGAPPQPDESVAPLAAASALVDSGGFFNRTLTFPAVVPIPQHGQFAVVVSMSGGSCQGVNWPVNDYYANGLAVVSDNNGPWTQFVDASGGGRYDMPLTTLTMPSGLDYLGTYRSGHAAVTLADNRVLILGSDATAEIYDPVAHTSTPTGSMSVPRFAATATLLANGKVLVAGGLNTTCTQSGCTSTTPNTLELFDPSANSGAGAFSVVGTLNSGRYWHAATLLADGSHLLVTGGWTQTSPTTSQMLSSAEVIDTTTFTASAPIAMLSARSQHTATLLACPAANPTCAWGGSVLVAGGYGSFSQVAEIFTPSLSGGTFTATAGAMAYRAAHAAAALTTGAHAGQVLLTGGQIADGSTTTTTDLFDPATSTFSAGPAMAQRRLGHAMVVASDGRVVVLGGGNYVDVASALADVEIADANLTQFDRSADLLVDRETPTANLITGGAAAGSIAVIGGYSTSWLSGRSVELYPMPPPELTMQIANGPMPDGAVGIAYPATPITVTGSLGAVQTSIVWGQLPPGLALSSNQIVSAPAPTAAGVYSFTVKATDSTAPVPQAATRTFTITIDHLAWVSPPSLPTASPSQAYSYQLSATGTAPIVYTLQPNSASGAAVSVSEGGLVTFTAPASGNVFFTVRARDGSGQTALRSFYVFVAPPLAIVNAPLPDVVATWGPGGCIQTTGGAGAITLTTTTGTLPYGLSLLNYGCFTGTARETGAFTFGVHAADSTNPPQTADANVTLRVGTADQAQFGIDTTPGAPAIAFGGGTAAAQVFTPMVSGYLLDVNVPVACDASLHADIQAVTGGQPNGSVLASTDVAASLLTPFNGSPYHRAIAFATPLFVRPGEPLAIVMTTTGNCAITPMAVGAGSPGGNGFTGSAGTWTPLDPSRPQLPFHEIIDEGGRFSYMMQGRSGHSDTPLTQGAHAGLVLLAGGFGYTSGTEFFNPTAAPIGGVDPGRFAAGPTINVPRAAATLTEMPDGSVLLVGGYDPNGYAIGSIERFDPVANTWTVAGSLATPRYHHTATLVSGGRLLIAGGRSDASPALASAEVLTISGASVTTSSLPSMTTGRSDHRAALLADGRVLLTGGWGVGAPYAAEIFDPSSSSFAPAGAMHSGRVLHTETRLGDGSVLVAGGSDESFTASVGDAEIYDPSTNTFTAISASELREGADAVRLADGRVLLAGGSDHAGTALRTTSVFDPATRTFAAASDLTVARLTFTATPLNDGRVLVAGGCCNSATQWATAEIFDPSLHIAPLATANAFYTMTIGAPSGSTFALVSGALPPGLALNGSTGAVAGTAGATGAYRFTVAITSAAGRRTLRELAIQVGAADVLTATAGGNGGSPYSMTCPADHLVTALKGRAGDDMDRTELWCSQVFSPGNYGAASLVNAIGGFGGNPYDFTCPAGMRLTGVYGHAGIVLWGGNVVDTMGAICTNPSTNATYQSPEAGNLAPGTAPFTLTCPGSMSVAGFYGGQGSLLDRIGLVCR